MDLLKFFLTPQPHLSNWGFLTAFTWLLLLKVEVLIVKMMKNIEKIFDAEEVIEDFEVMTKDAGRIQEETLRKILKENEGTEYLKQWDLNGRTDVETFKACVPIVSHNDLNPYIQRIADGDLSPILTGKPIQAISLR